VISAEKFRLVFKDGMKSIVMLGLTLLSAPVAADC